MGGISGMRMRMVTLLSGGRERCRLWCNACEGGRLDSTPYSWFLVRELANNRRSCLQTESPRCRSEYFSGGLCIALTIGLFVAAVELAVLFPVRAGPATKSADGKGPALFIDTN
jgi:hypothetical protein